MLLPAGVLNAADSASVVNVRAKDLGALALAATDCRLTLAPTRADATQFPGKLLIWEAREGNDAALTEASSRALGEYVRQGGSLLLTLQLKAGEMPLRSAYLLPTTAWMTRSNQRDESVRVAQWDAEIFGAAQPAGLELPFYHDIRPFHAVERGQGRYEPYAGLIKDIVKPPLTLTPTAPFWTRPLLNRDWQVRVRGAGLTQPPLLLTGRYGAGRVAVFAADAAALGNTPAARAFWAVVLKWLTAAEQSPTAPHGVKTIPAPVIALEPTKRVLKVTLTNPSDSPLPLRVLGRILTWEPALVGDVQREVTLKPKSSATVELPLPTVNATAYAALQARDAWVVRLGVLSADGSELLAESRVPVDFRPSAVLSVALPESRSVPWPFTSAPEPGMGNRMGTPMATYACKPGQATEVEVVLDNTGRNLAPLAVVRDESDPGNASASALTDGFALAERKTEWFLQHHGSWEGRSKQENVLSFTFPRPVRIHLITLSGTPDEFRNQQWKNPQAVSVEIDGKQVLSEPRLAPRFAAEGGIVRLPVAGVTGKVVQLRLPWNNAVGRAMSPALGEVEIFGTEGAELPPTRGSLSVKLVDAFNGTVTPLKQQTIEVAPGQRQALRIPLEVPRTAGVNFYRVEARFGTQTASAPLLAIDPVAPLQPLDSLKGTNGVAMGFIVTRGFRNFFDTGVGTAEIGEGWGQPDDLVWAHARGLKQNGARAKYRAARLYVTPDNLAHYSTPWRHFFNGEDFYDVGIPYLVQRMQEQRNWKNADTVVLEHSDRWDTGPDPDSCYGWQEFEAFNDWLQARKLGTLNGQTWAEIGAEIETTWKSQWSAFHLGRYAQHLRALRAAFAAEHKKLVLRAQGAPLIPPGLAAEITSVVTGCSDDWTWGMLSDNLPATTGRQMGTLAFTPSLLMSTLVHWGYNSGTLGNMQWHGAIGTTEPSRRTLYDRAFRGTIRPDGRYGSLHTYGYNSNAGDPYTLTGIDYDHWNRVKTLHSLLTPELPWGAGLVIANGYLDDPKNTRFYNTDPMGAEEVRAVSRTVELLQNQGLSLPFAANALCLEKWTGTAPLILLNLSRCTAREIDILRRTAARGVKLVALCAVRPIPASAGELFGVTSDGAPAAGKQVAEIAGRPVVAAPGRLFVPLNPDQMSRQDVQQVAPLLGQTLDTALTFADGTTGYGFVSNGRSFVVVEDWREEPRIAPLHIHGNLRWQALRAVNVNDHTSLATRREGDDWVVDVPVAAGAGVLVALEMN